MVSRIIPTIAFAGLMSLLAPQNPLKVQEENSRIICNSTSIDDVVFMLARVPPNEEGVHSFTNPFKRISYEATVKGTNTLVLERVVDPLAITYGQTSRALGAQRFYINLSSGQISYVNPTSGVLASDIIGNYSLCARLDEFERLMYKEMTL